MLVRLVCLQLERLPVLPRHHLWSQVAAWLHHPRQQAHCCCLDTSQPAATLPLTCTTCRGRPPARAVDPRPAPFPHSGHVSQGPQLLLRANKIVLLRHPPFEGLFFPSRQTPAASLLQFLRRRRRRRLPPSRSRQIQTALRRCQHSHFYSHRRHCPHNLRQYHSHPPDRGRRHEDYCCRRYRGPTSPKPECPRQRCRRYGNGRSWSWRRRRQRRRWLPWQRRPPRRWRL